MRVRWRTQSERGCRKPLRLQNTQNAKIELIMAWQLARNFVPAQASSPKCRLPQSFPQPTTGTWEQAFPILVRSQPSKISFVAHPRVLRNVRWHCEWLAKPAACEVAKQFGEPRSASQILRRRLTRGWFDVRQSPIPRLSWRLNSVGPLGRHFSHGVSTT